MKHCLAGPNVMCRKAEPRTADEVGGQPAEGPGGRKVARVREGVRKCNSKPVCFATPDTLYWNCSSLGVIKTS